MGFLDSKLDSVKNKVSGLFDSFSESNSVGNLLGSAFGGLTDAFDGIYDAVSGVFKPQFESLAEAEDALFNEQPTPPVPGSIYESDTHAYDSGSSYGDFHMIRGFVRHEFANRERDFGLHYTHGSGGEAADEVLDDPNDGYAGEIYRGPRSAWARICSNTVYEYGKTNTKFDGFIMHGVNDFDDVYGFGPGTTKEFSSNVLGYDVNGQQHTVEERMFKHRPCPGVTSIDSETIENMHNGRKTTINITCWSRSQLDYLQPYFFNPGITIVVEWGWNNYPRECLIDLTDVGYSKDEVAEDWSDRMKGIRPHEESSGLVGLWSDVEYSTNHIKKGRGNYMYLIGMVTTFNYSIRDDGGYDCTLEVQNIGGLAHDQKTGSGKKKCGTSTSDDPDEVEEAEEDAAEDLEYREEDFESFVDDYLTEYLDQDDDEKGVDVRWGTGGPTGGNYMTNRTKAKVTRGRYFTPDTLDSKANYEMGFSEKSYYITFGLLLDFVNEFYGKTTFSSNKAKATVFKFTCERTRLAAHPNIKSLDGKVLLIPNSTSPRRNGGPSTAVSSSLTSSARGVDSSELTLALRAAASTNSKDTKAETLASAMEMSPRDDLFDILATKAVSQGNRRFYIDYTQMEEGETSSVLTSEGRTLLRKATVEEKAVKPFPDYLPGSSGYSGRLKDLFVNVEVIKDAVSANNKVEGFLKDILQKMSQAAGGIWDFNFTSESRSTPNSTTTAIVDRNYTGLASVDEHARGGSVFTFNSHTKNSIIQSMSLSVELSGEVATEVLGQAGQDDASKEGRVFAQSGNDRLLAEAPRGSCDGEGRTKKDGEKEDIEEPDRYIIVKELQVEVETGLFEWDGVDTKEINIELVDTNVTRAMKGMRKDKNPQNNINYNGPVDEIELEIQLQGISGIRIMDAFNCTGIPTIYFTRGMFGVTSVKDAISENNWTTTLTGLYYPNSNETAKK